MARPCALVLLLIAGACAPSTDVASPTPAETSAPLVTPAAAESPSAARSPEGTRAGPGPGTTTSAPGVRGPAPAGSPSALTATTAITSPTATGSPSGGRLPSETASPGVAAPPTIAPITPAPPTPAAATTAPPPAVTPVPVIPPLTTTPDTARRDCSTESTTATRTTGGATTVEFVNAGAAPVEFFWLDASGARKPYGTLPSGARTTQATFASHPWLVALSTGQCLAIFIAPTAPGRVVVGDEQALASFYGQTRAVEGLTVKASAKVRAAALDEAARRFSLLLRGDRSVVDRMRAGGVQVAIIAQSEATTDLPEYRSLQGRRTSDGRGFDGPSIRGLGGSRTQPMCSVGEENVLGLAGDIFAGESILIHECGHSVYNVGLDDLRRAQWRQIYAAAIAAGRWTGTYAAGNDDEFFAELTQSFFGVNQRPNAVHNDVNGADRLQAYEPDAYALLLSVYGSPP